MPFAALDIDEILDRGLFYKGISFASKPAALRQLLLVREIVEHLPVGSWLTGVDLGSKYDDLGHILGAHGIRCTRVDIENRPGNHPFILGDGESLPFADASVGFVVLSHVIAHVENVDRLLTEVNRVLVPGGRLFVLQSNRYGWWKFWGYYLRRNDRVSHWRTIDAWGIRRYLFDADLEIEDMYAPYHFYLHSKLSELFYRIDRSLEHRVPSAIATQWVVRARKRSSGEEASIKPRMLTIPEVVVLAALATGQAVGIKTLELATRVIHGGHSVAEHT